jgi:hypothetical protein
MRAALIVFGCLFATFTVLAGTIYAASETLDTTKTDEESFGRSIDRVVIRADSGDIDVVPGGRSIQVRETRDYVLDSPETSRTVEDGVLTIEAECDGSLSLFCATDYRVEVPAGVTVDVRTYVGDIDIDGISSRRVAARSYVGDVHVDARRRADVDARTNVGDVDVELPAGRYDVETDAPVGDSELHGIDTSDRAKRQVEARTDVGDVDVTAR